MQSSDVNKPQVYVCSGHPELYKFILSHTAQPGLLASREVSGLTTSDPTWYIHMDLGANYLDVIRNITISTMSMPFFQLPSDQTQSSHVDNLILVPTLLLIICWITDKLFLLHGAQSPYLIASN